MTAGLVEHWLESGRLELPLPASGRTAERWQRLAQLAEDNIDSWIIGQVREGEPGVAWE